MHVQIGIIADTHSKMRPEAVEVLQGSDFILHAGDVGRDEVLEALEAIAPVVPGPALYSADHGRTVGGDRGLCGG